MTTSFAALREYDSEYAPSTPGIDIASDEYSNLLEAGWAPFLVWNVEELGTNHTIIRDIKRV